MEFPDSLPCILEYACGPVVIYALPRTPVSSVGSNGQTNEAIVHPQIPYGAYGWRLTNREEWQPLSSLPTEWMPYLNRNGHPVRDVPGAGRT